jgi:argininosuccinate lyase
MVTLMLEHITVNEHILDDPRYDLMFSVEEVNRLTLSGMPFRDAYKKVGLDIEAGKFTPVKEVHHTHEGSIGNLCHEQVEQLMQQTVDSFHFDRAEQAIARLISE